MIVVEDAGLLTTAQDLGRDGHGAWGVARSGAADTLALRLANRLLGNEDGAAALETTLTGCTLRALTDTRVALAGAPCDATIRNGAGERAAPMLRALRLGAGDTLTVGPAQRGVRTIVALAGGVRTPEVLASRSTHATTGFGAPDGRPLRAGYELPLGADRCRRVITDRDALVALARAALSDRLRVLPGIHAALREPLTRTVANASDRVGVRLEGPRFEIDAPAHIPSEAMHHGAIQRTPDGALVALGPDGAPTGGYPVVATVALVDLPALAQLRPRAGVRLEPIDHDAALALLREREALIERAARVHTEDAS